MAQNEKSLLKKWLAKYNTPTGEDFMKMLPFIIGVCEWGGIEEMINDIKSNSNFVLNVNIFDSGEPLENSLLFPANIIKVDKNLDYPNSILIPIYHYYNKRNVRSEIRYRLFEGVEKMGDVWVVKWGN